MSSCVKINNTSESKNFSSWGHDRSIVAVDFADPGGQPSFPTYREEANRNYPNIWSWIPGWSVSSRFANEADMLENQTFVKIGKQGGSSSGTYNWKLDEVDINLFSDKTVFDWTGSYGSLTAKWDRDDEIDINAYIDYTISNYGVYIPIVFIRLRQTLESGKSFDNNQFDGPGSDDNTVSYTVEKSDDIGTQDIILVAGRCWIVTLRKGTTKALPRTIIIESGEGSSVDLINEESYYWEDSVAYQNESYDVDADSSTSFGITTVTIDLSDVLDNDEECVYIFNGEYGEERVSLEV